MHKAEFQIRAFDKKAKAETSEITKGIFFFFYLLAILGWKVKDCSLHLKDSAKGPIIWFVLLRNYSRIILCHWRGRWFTNLKTDGRELETK